MRTGSAQTPVECARYAAIGSWLELPADGNIDDEAKPHIRTARLPGRQRRPSNAQAPFYRRVCYVVAGVISPLLANIYLHYVLDVWFETEVKPRMRGHCFLVRFADDFVIGFQCEDDARRVMDVLPKRSGNTDWSCIQRRAASSTSAGPRERKRAGGEPTPSTLSDLPTTGRGQGGDFGSSSARPHAKRSGRRSRESGTGAAGTGTGTSTNSTECCARSCAVTTNTLVCVATCEPWQRYEIKCAVLGVSGSTAAAARKRCPGRSLRHCWSVYRCRHPKSSTQSDRLRGSEVMHQDWCCDPDYRGTG
jgi:hypothetical protein